MLGAGDRHWKNGGFGAAYQAHDSRFGLLHLAVPAASPFWKHDEGAIVVEQFQRPAVRSNVCTVSVNRERAVGTEEPPHERAAYEQRVFGEKANSPGEASAQ